MSKAKARFTIPNGSTLVPTPGGPSFVAGDEDKLRAALSHEDIDAMISAGHLTPAEPEAVEAAPAAVAPVATPAPAKG